MARVILIEAVPWDNAGNAVNVYLAGGGSRGYDHRGRTTWIGGIVKEPKFSAAIGFDENGWTGGALPNAAKVGFHPSDKATLTAVAAYQWPEAAITVLVGDDSSVAPAWTTLLSGIVKSITITDGKIEFTVADLGLKLADPFIKASEKFAGTGTIEGDADIEGRVKRRTFGRCYNVEGRLLLKASNIYEFGNPANPLSAFVAVKDKGREAAPAPTVVAWQGSIAATLNALIASTPVNGSCVVAPSIACVKWWTQPAGPLTADIDGEVGAGFTNYVVQIAGRIMATVAGGPAYSGNLANNYRADEAGIHCDDPNESTANVLDRLLLGAGLTWIVDPAGVVYIREFVFTGSVETITVEAVDRLESYRPVTSRRIAYKRAYRKHSDGEISATLLQLDASAQAQIDAATTAIAYAADDGRFTVNEKNTELIKADKALRARMHSTLMRASALGVLAASQNLFTYSEQFDNAAWGKINGGTGAAPVVTANAAVAPDGTTTADRIVFARGANSANADYSLVYQATASALAAATAGSGRVFLKSATGQPQTVMAYAVNNTEGTVAAVGTVEVGTDWAELELNSATLAGGTVLFIFGTRGSTGGATYGGDRDLDLYVWGAQYDTNRFCRPYVRTTTAAITQAAVGAAPDAVYSAFANYRDALDFCFPLWNDLTQDSVIYPAESITAQQFDFSNAAWTKTNATAARTAPPNFDYWDLADASGAQTGVVDQALVVTAGKTMTATISIKKDAVGRATRYPALKLFNGADDATIYFDTSTGAFLTAGTLIVAGSTVVDCGTYWLVVLVFSTGAYTALTWRFAPAIGANAALGAGIAASAQGTVSVRRPVVFLGTLASMDRPSFRARTNALEQRLADLLKAITEAQPSVEVPGSIQLDANSGGTTTTSLPLTARCKCWVGGVDQSANANWVLGTLPAGITATINNTAGDANRGVISVTVGDAPGNLTVNCTPPGYSEITKQVVVTRTAALATSGGGAGSSYVNDATFPTVNSGTLADVSDIMTVRSTAGGTLIFSAILRHISSTPGAISGIKARYRTTAGPGAWNDLAAEVTGSADDVDAETGIPIKGVTVISDTTKTGLTASTDYDVVLQARRFSGAGTLTFSNSSFTVRQVA